VFGDEGRGHSVVSPAQRTTHGGQIVVVDLIGAAWIEIVGVAVVLQTAYGYSCGEMF